MGNKISVYDLTNSTAILQIYFSTTQSQNIASVPAYNFMALLSDIGGALGLLLGATLLTVIETAEFLLLIIHDLIKTKRKNNRCDVATGGITPQNCAQVW